MRPRPLYKVLIVGDRDWGDAEAIRRDVRRLKKKYGNDLLIISGGAPGADTLSRIVAVEEDVHHAQVPALWGTRHRGAGPQRNDIMARMLPAECIAYHPNIAKSRGTKDMVSRCGRYGIPVTLRDGKEAPKT